MTEFFSSSRPAFICAPMVRQSELAFRKLVRKYGVNLAYTPMINARNFVRAWKEEREGKILSVEDSAVMAEIERIENDYRKENFNDDYDAIDDEEETKKEEENVDQQQQQSDQRYAATNRWDASSSADILATMDIGLDPEDVPVVVQFCANRSVDFVCAAKIVEKKCFAVDLNLGCPQQCALRGHYGSFLMEEPERVCRIVALASKELSVPMWCKIRLHPNLEDSIRWAQQLVSSGCRVLCVHGRTRDMKSRNDPADWEAIRKSRCAVNVPLFANGAINSLDDAMECLKATGADGVMSATGLLRNPRLFQGGPRSDSVEMAREYLEFAKIHTPKNPKVLRDHLLHVLEDELESQLDISTSLHANDLIFNIDQCEHVLRLLESRMGRSVEGPVLTLNQIKRLFWVEGNDDAIEDSFSLFAEE